MFIPVELIPAAPSNWAMPACCAAGNAVSGVAAGVPALIAALNEVAAVTALVDKPLRNVFPAPKNSDADTIAPLYFVPKAGFVGLMLISFK